MVFRKDLNRLSSMCIHHTFMMDSKTKQNYTFAGHYSVYMMVTVIYVRVYVRVKPGGF